MKLLLICPIPVEFRACREVMGLRDSAPLGGCRTAAGSCGGAEILAVESGPAKVRSASAAALACARHGAELLIDTGSCAAIEPTASIGQLVVALDCYEYDIAGDGLPARSMPEMRLPSVLSLMQPAQREELLRGAAEIGAGAGLPVRFGHQACGEYLVRSAEARQALHALFAAVGANWETAGVFVAALRGGVPPLSIRVATDLGDEQALSQFRANVKTQTRALYTYLRALAEYGWFGQLLESWASLPAGGGPGLAELVLPRGG